MSTTEPPLPVPEDDALDAAASAVVDGVATVEESDLVAAAPEGQARVATLRAVAEAVGWRVPEQGADAATRALAAATAAFDDDGLARTPAVSPFAPTVSGGAGGDPHDPFPTAAAGGGSGGSKAPVSTLPRPATSGRWLPRLGAIAAVLMLLAGIGTLAVGLFGNRSDPQVSSARSGDASVAATAPGKADDRLEAGATAGAPTAAGRTGGPTTAQPGQTGTPGGAVAPDQAGAPGQPGGPGAAAAPRPGDPATPAPGAPPPPPVVDGGEFGNQVDVDALAQRAAAALDSTPDPATTGNAALPSDVQACVDVGAAGLKEKIGALRYRAVGSFQGRPVVVLVYDREGSPPRLLLVLTRSDCALISFTEL